MNEFQYLKDRKCNKVLVVNPHPQSLASGLLLRQHLFHQREVDKRSDWRKSLSFRNRWLKNKELTCYYCGKTNLKLNHFGRPKSECATIDHKVPLSKGGDDTDANKVVCCLACNAKKGTKTVEEFIKIVQGRKS